MWEDEWTPKEAWSSALSTTFGLDDDGRPTKNEEVYSRLDALERYCYQTRGEE